jgi:hypothetical protein
LFTFLFWNPWWCAEASITTVTRHAHFVDRPYKSLLDFVDASGGMRTCVSVIDVKGGEKILELTNIRVSTYCFVFVPESWIIIVAAAA